MPKETEAKKALKELTDFIVIFESAMDDAMAHPESVERGKHIARYMNRLSVANQIAMRGGLDYSLPKIEKMYSNEPAPPKPKRVRKKSGVKSEDIFSSNANA